MGHNRAPNSGNRCCRAGVYFTREEYESIKLAAKDRELSVSEFVRSAAVDRANVQEILRATEARERRKPITESESHCATCGMPNDEEWEEETLP